MPRALIAAIGLWLVAMLAGCGGGDTPLDGDDLQENDSVTLGSLQVGLAATAGFKTLTLNSPDSSQIGFTVLYGSRIVRLQETGYGKIAFASARSSRWEIYVMNSDGSGVTRLTDTAGDNIEPDWSPDGQRIVFNSSRDGNNELYVMNANGSGQTRLTNTPTLSERNPDWSPDGSRIAFQSLENVNTDIWTMDPNGTNLLRLTVGTGYKADPSWAPNSAEIAYTGLVFDNYEIFRMNADGSGSLQLTSAAGDDAYADWSPDGSQIAFRANRVAGSGGDLYVMNADGTNQFRLTRDAGSDQSPAWSPDGRYIAFGKNVPGGSDIYVVEADGSNPTNLTHQMGNDQYPSWRPTPSVLRAYVGANGSDGGSNPPFGTARPLVIVGQSDDGVVNSAALFLPEARWGTVAAAAINNLGSKLVGLKITGTDLRRLDEDLGRGRGLRSWGVTGTPPTGAMLVFLSASTGRVASVVASADTALTSARELATQAAGGRIVLQGRFIQAYSAADPSRNLVNGAAGQLAMDSTTGEIIAAE